MDAIDKMIEQAEKIREMHLTLLKKQIDALNEKNRKLHHLHERALKKRIEA